MKKRITEKEIQKANIKYHTKLADFYDKEQGHFKPENVQRVERVIKDLAQKTGGGSLLDIGCGTGFIINIAQKYFDRVIGIDITLAMLKKIKKFKNVELHLMDLFSAPYRDEFDVCTTYSVLHHLSGLKTAFKKIYKFLKNGGYFYADQDPNFYYLERIKRNKRYLLGSSGLISKEWKSITEIDTELKNKFNLSKKITALAEYQKLTREDFFKEMEIINLLKRAGFAKVNFKYQWFLGQGYFKREFSQEQLAKIEDYLEKILPLSSDLFKYISFIAKK